MSNENLGFSYTADRANAVMITRDGVPVTILRGETAAKFLTQISTLTVPAQQQEMARITGNYKRGNERNAKQHPRNQD